MPITVGLLFRDSINFMRNQFAALLLLAILIGFLQTQGHVFIPEEYVQLQTQMLKNTQPDLATLAPEVAEKVKTVQEEFPQLNAQQQNLVAHVMAMSPEKRQEMLKNALIVIFLSLLLFTLLVASVLTLLNNVSRGQRTSALQALGSSLLVLPRLLLLIVITFIIISAGISFFLIPGIIFAILLILSPVILVTEGRGIFFSMSLSMKLGWKNIWQIIFILVTTIAASIVLGAITLPLAKILPMYLWTLLLTVIQNLLITFAIVYLFRIYMLARQQ